MTAASNAGQLSLCRSGGVRDRSFHGVAPEICAAGLALMLVAVDSPNSAFYACANSFAYPDGWMDFDQEDYYHHFLGAPQGEAVYGTDGLIRRSFEGANVTLDITAFSNDTSRADMRLNRGCVQWSTGETSGICPE